MKNILFCILGASGSGKTSVGEAVFGKEREIISFTSREKRLGEVDGIDYHFLTTEEVLSKIAEGELAEYTTYAGNYYGITKEEIESKLKTSDAYAVVNLDGYQQLVEIVGEDLVVGIYLETNVESVKNALIKRGDSKENIQSRLVQFQEDVKSKEHVDYHVNSVYGELNQLILDFKRVVLEVKEREL